MLTFRIAMTAAVMTFDHRDDQASRQRRYGRGKPDHRFSLAAAALLRLSQRRPAALERRQSYGYGAALIR